MHTAWNAHQPRGRRAAVLGTLTAALARGPVAGVVGPVEPARRATADGDGERRASSTSSVVTKTIERQKYAAPVVEQKDDSMNVGETKVVRPGRPGSAT